jgi:hypothetical protein
MSEWPVVTERLKLVPQTRDDIREQVEQMDSSEKGTAFWGMARLYSMDPAPLIPGFMALSFRIDSQAKT